MTDRHTTNTTPALTPEREAEYREHVAGMDNYTLGNLAARDLLAELDRVRAERDEALARVAELEAARTTAEHGAIRAAAAWQKAEARATATPAPEPGVVAYRSPGGSVLRCLLHAPDQSLIDHGNYSPVASEDLEDGGVCTYPGCGVDVLITPVPSA